MLDHSCQVQRAPLEDRKDDLYETPDVAVHALLRVERLPHHIWECACGPGRIVKILRATGFDDAKDAIGKRIAGGISGIAGMRLLADAQGNATDVAAADVALKTMSTIIDEIETVTPDND